MKEFTIDELRGLIKNNSNLVTILVGEYEFSIAYGRGSYCTPRSRLNDSELDSVEIALFKLKNFSRRWVLPNEIRSLGFDEMASYFEDVVGASNSVAGYIPLEKVVEYVNMFRKLEGEKKEISDTCDVVQVSRVKHRCVRCGSYDDYVEGGGLCYRCC